MEKPCCNSCAKGKQCEDEIHNHKQKKNRYSDLKYPDVDELVSTKRGSLIPLRGNKALRQLSKTEYEDLEDDGDDNYVTTKEAIGQIHEVSNKNRIDNSKVQFIEDTASVIQAIIRPDLYRSICFPSNFSTPGVPVHKMNTITLKTNDFGYCWAEVNFGQYLAPTKFTNTVNGTLAVARGSSNVYVFDPDAETAAFFDGQKLISDIGAGANVQAFRARDILKENLELFNAVRAGPAAVWYDFTGRLDTSSGIVTCGINYTYVTDPAAPTVENGFLPDLNFVSQKAIEDCPYRIQTSVVNSVHGVFLPHDTEVLNLKGTTEGHRSIVQRFFICITGAAKNEVIGQIKIATNFDAKPSAALADSIATQITKSPSVGAIKEASDYLIKNGMVLREAKDQGYGIMRFSQDSK